MTTCRPRESRWPRMPLTPLHVVLQARQARNELRHNDGMSSDDEMPPADQASLGKVKQVCAVCSDVGF